MKLVDANVLVNVVNVDSSDHLTARRWLDTQLSGAGPVGFAWLVLVAFIRISTHARLMDRPLSIVESTAIVDGWLASSSAYVLQPTEQHASLLSRMLLGAGAAGNLTNDAHLAALAIEHKATIVTFDADFDRFPGVRWERPA